MLMLEKEMYIAKNDGVDPRKQQQKRRKFLLYREMNKKLIDILMVKVNKNTHIYKI